MAEVLCPQSDHLAQAGGRPRCRRGQSRGFAQRDVWGEESSLGPISHRRPNTADVVKAGGLLTRKTPSPGPFEVAGRDMDPLATRRFRLSCGRRGPDERVERPYERIVGPPDHVRVMASVRNEELRGSRRSELLPHRQRPPRDAGHGFHGAATRRPQSGRHLHGNELAHAAASKRAVASRGERRIRPPERLLHRHGEVAVHRPLVRSSGGRAADA
jgi:hypothetical protein